MIGYAVDLAERQLREGTAAPSTINLYLRMGTSAYRTEQERLKAETELTLAKRDNFKSMARQEEYWKEALEALRRYQGVDEEEIYD